MKGMLNSLARAFGKPTRTRVASPQEEQVRPPADALAEARANPGGYVYVIGGGFGPRDETPFAAIIGWWKVDGDGEIRQPFEENTDYDAEKYPRTSAKS